MSCLFHLFSKNPNSKASHGPKLPPLKKRDSVPKPTFCIYDSDDSEAPAEHASKESPSYSSRNEFPLLDSFQLLKDNPISLPQPQDYFKETSKDTNETLPSNQPCYPCSVISTGYQEVFLADTFFVFLTLNEEDHKHLEQRHHDTESRKSSLSFALLQLETEKRELNFDKSLPFIPQSKFPRMRKFSTSPPHSPTPYSGPEDQHRMGSSDSKLSFKRAVEQLGSPGPVEAGDEAVWDQLCQESLSSIHDVFTLLPAEEIRKLREDSPANLSTLCYKVSNFKTKMSTKKTGLSSKIC